MMETSTRLAIGLAIGLTIGLLHICLGFLCFRRFRNSARVTSYEPPITYVSPFDVEYEPNPVIHRYLNPNAQLEPQSNATGGSPIAPPQRSQSSGSLPGLPDASSTAAISSVLQSPPTEILPPNLVRTATKQVDAIQNGAYGCPHCGKGFEKPHLLK